MCDYFGKNHFNILNSQPEPAHCIFSMRWLFFSALKARASQSQPEPASQSQPEQKKTFLTSFFYVFLFSLILGHFLKCPI
jgi:hypothetical protein